MKKLSIFCRYKKNLGTESWKPDLTGGEGIGVEAGEQEVLAREVCHRDRLKVGVVDARVARDKAGLARSAGNTNLFKQKDF